MIRQENDTYLLEFDGGTGLVLLRGLSRLHIYIPA